MDFKDCVAFANENRISYLATDDNGQPRVRPMSLWFADNSGFYYQATSDKDMCRQLRKNNRVEMCIYAPGAGGPMGKMMRVTGKVHFIEDRAYKIRALEDRPFLKNRGIESPEDPRLVLFKIYTGEAFFWTAAGSSDSERKPIAF